VSKPEQKASVKALAFSFTEPAAFFMFVPGTAYQPLFAGLIDSSKVIP
jgi:hypothetical protein